MSRVDIEPVVCAAMTRECGFPCYQEVPESPPAEFATCARRGGGETQGQVDNPTLVLAFRAPNRRRAHEMKEAGKACVKRLPAENPHVMGAEINSDYREDDPETGHPRYKLTAILNVM